MNMDRIFLDYFSLVFQNRSAESNILSLLQVLSKHVKFDHAMFSIFYFQQSFLMPILLYSNNEILRINENKNAFTTSGLEFFRMDTAVVIDNSAEISPNKMLLYFPSHKTLLCSNYIAPTNANYFYTLTLFSDIANGFSAEDVQCINSMRSVIQLVCNDILEFSNQVDSTKFLFPPANPYDLLQMCKGLKDVCKKIQLVAQTDIPVLILGETGVGKELVANSIVTLSARRSQAFVKINCPSINESLLESELFGHEKGAFTSATFSHQGYFEQADKGTLFLDEVGDLCQSSQAKFLRVLENGEIRRIGGSKSIHVDVRMLFATSQDLKKMMEKSTFRRDLWYRISTFPIEIPPLRQRKEDIPVLAEYFYQKAIEKYSTFSIPSLDEETRLRFLQYDWPGNVRELSHVIEQGILNSIDRKHFIIDIPYITGKNAGSSNTKELNVETIHAALQKCNGRIYGKNGAANLLNVNSNTLRFRMAKLGMEVAQHKRKSLFNYD